MLERLSTAEQVQIVFTMHYHNDFPETQKSELLNNLYNVIFKNSQPWQFSNINIIGIEISKIETAAESQNIDIQSMHQTLLSISTSDEKTQYIKQYQNCFTEPIYQEMLGQISSSEIRD